MRFILPKPRKPKFGETPATQNAGDVDKLMRCVGDCLTRIIYRDDSRIVRAVLTKEFGAEPGCHVTVRRTGKQEELF